MNNKDFFAEEEQIKKDIEKARQNVDDSPSVERKSPKPVENNEEEPLTPKEVVREIVSVVLNVLVCFLVVFLITQFIGQRTVVSGSSMEDTLSDGDNLIVDKISYRFSDPKRFDVVVFPYQYEEDALPISILNAGLASSEIVLGANEYFVLGDNRNNSTDSRFEAVGNINGDDLVGRAWLRVYPFSEFGLVENIE